MKWLSPDHQPFELCGFPFFSRDHMYRRVQVNPPEPLPKEVDFLANQTAGGQIRFRAVLETLDIRVRLNAEPEMDHMPATGEGGFDCYISEGTDEPLYVSTARLEERGREYTATLFSFPKKRELNVVLNFPLYKGVEKVELGVDDDAAVLPPHPLRQGRIAVYGGSIDQGACASRPGMAYTNILSRWMNTEFVNWGFSGSGKAEAEVAKALSEIDDVRLFVINTAGNCPSASYLRAHLPAFLDILRRRYPYTPILLYALPVFPFNRFAESVPVTEQKVQVEIETYRRRVTQGDRHLYFYRSRMQNRFRGHSVQYETTVDGLHPNDYGMMQMAQELYVQIQKVLEQEGKQ